jgi:hypothetical protein
LTESRRTRVLGVLVLLWLLPSVGFPQSVDNPATFSIFFENDLFGDTDQHYTSGIKLSWMSPDLKSYRDSGRVPDWPQPFVEPVLFFETPRRGEETLVSRNVIASLGHNIFTPQDLMRFDTVCLPLRGRAPLRNLRGLCSRSAICSALRNIDLYSCKPT